MELSTMFINLVDLSRPAPVEGTSGAPAPSRWPLLALVVLGVALVLTPFAIGLFSTAPKGAKMLADFRPFMTSARLEQFQVEMREVNAGVLESNNRVASLLYGPGASGRQQLAANVPTFARFNNDWPAIDASMTDLLDRVQGNLGNYDAVAALPSFELFPWFFVVPGLLIAGFAVVGLTTPRWWRRARRAVVVIGLGMVLAPVAFQMFDRAPAGGRMIDAFRTIETTQRVRTMQGYFGTMAVGQGSIRLELVPALQHTGLTPDQIQARFAAVSALDRDWVHILNDMTPMIGAMSDNVTSYRAMAALPPFTLFPWFFVGPGVLIAALALKARTPRIEGTS